MMALKRLAALPALIPAVVRTRGAALLAVGVFQLCALAYMVGDRVRHLAVGREIELPIVPVDPRDLFKGDFVELAYGISDIKSALWSGAPPSARGVGYVTLEKDAAGVWAPIRFTAVPPAPNTRTANQIVLQARTAQDWGRATINRVRYGIERYYVPEGKGGALEKLARDKKLSAVVAVDGRGRAAIKGLSADGVRLYEEPLF